MRALILAGLAMFALNSGALSQSPTQQAPPRAKPARSVYPLTPEQTLEENRRAMIRSEARWKELNPDWKMRAEANAREKKLKEDRLKSMNGPF